MQNSIKSENITPYNVTVDEAEKQDDLIEQALAILYSRLTTKGAAIGSPSDSVNYLKLKLATLEHEVFCVLFLDNRHRVIDYQEMFRGTINGASVHPREIAKEALKLNAAAVIFAHNHPSGVADPSQSDKALTRKLDDALSLFDIKALDHIVIAGSEHVSFSERGLM